MLTIQLLCLLGLVGFCMVQVGAVTRPGLQLTFAQNGLDMVGKVATDVLTRKLPGERIKDIHGVDHMKVGKVTYDIQNIAVQSFTNPSSTVTITPRLGITWSLNGAGTAVHADWHIKYKYHFIRIKDSGSLDISASGVSASVSCKMGVDKAGRPTIFTTACSSNVAHLKVRFHGGASWLYNLFDHMIANSIKKSLAHTICKSAEKVINIDAQKKIAEFKTLTPVSKKMELDYSLIQAPVFSKGFVQSMHKGLVTWKSDPKPFPAEPAVFPPVTDFQHKMVYISASEYVINSFCYAAYSHGLARYNLSAERLSKPDAGKLNTTCHGFLSVCIGNFLPMVAKKYPNSTVSIAFDTAKAPYFQISPKGINLTFDGDMTFRAKTPRNEVVYLFKMGIKVNMSVHAWLDNHTIKADGIAFKPKVHVIDSKVGNISDVNMQGTFNMASSIFIKKKLKSVGLKGIDIPNLTHISYVKPSLHLNKGSLLFGSDIVWTPKYYVKHPKYKNSA